MRSYYRHILLAATIINMAVSCTKEGPDSPAGESAICITAESQYATKAMLDAFKFNKNGNRIKVYDYVDDTTEHINAFAGPDVVSNSQLHQPGYTWPFTETIDGTRAKVYQWIPGSHNFFGWLAKDANMPENCDTPEDFFRSFSFNDKILTIGERTITDTSAQFDFLYSNITTTEPQAEAVKMYFNHLFTAVSFGVENSTSSFIMIEEFRVENLPSTRSAKIYFNGAETLVEYSEPTSARFTRGLDNGTAYEISPGHLRSNIFDGSTTQEFKMLWPIDAEYLYSSEPSTTNDEGIVEYPEEWKMYVKYTAENQTYVKRINFPPNIDLEAGKKYHFNIVFADKMVQLKTIVKPWYYQEQDINYTNDVVSESDGGVLEWDNTVSSVNQTTKMVSIVNAQPAKGEFTLQTPIGGTWIVSLVGDVNAFEVSPSTGTIDSQTATIYVKPLIDSPTRDYKVQLKFSVRRSDGRMIAADDVVQKNGIYTIVLPRNN